MRRSNEGGDVTDVISGQRIVFVSGDGGLGTYTFCTKCLRILSKSEFIQ